MKLAIAQSDEVNAIFYVALQSYNDLPGREKLRFANVMGPLMGGVATQWERQLQRGLDISAMAPDHLRFALNYLARPGCSNWWSQYRLMYPVRFRESIDDELATRNSTGDAV